MVINIARSSKGRLITKDETVSIKIRLDKTTAKQLHEVADELGIPIAAVIRQGINNVLVLHKQVK